MEFEFDWYPAKADTNLRKHGITFKFTTRVFEDPNRTEGLDDRDYQDEQCWVTTGQAAEFVLTVVFTQKRGYPPHLRQEGNTP